MNSCTHLSKRFFMPVNKLSLATTYIETFYLHAGNGEITHRSFATGFFLSDQNSFYLVTNWHVFSGLDPSNPQSAKVPPPNFLKISVIAKNGYLTEVTIPLYDPNMQPLWKEHHKHYEVDIAIYPLQISLAKQFQMLDIQKVNQDLDIKETVAKDVFILGYPFNREEMRSTFGEDAPYYLPVWKRGTIASEPSIRMAKRVILIDALSRPGMSGAPVLISEDREVARLSGENAAAWGRYQKGELSAIDAFESLDHNNISHDTEKRFRLLGVYSGVIGNTRLEQVALGKCWHADTLKELMDNPQPGNMPFHAPLKNEHYSRFFKTFTRGKLVTRDLEGNETTSPL